jgi:hypothetical protein
MPNRWKLAVLLPAVATLLALAGETRPLDEVQPRTVTFASDELALDQALVELQKQTGNVVHDRRAEPRNLKVKLPAKSGKFWPMLDAIGKATGTRISTYEADGGVALVDGAYRPLVTDYSGIFRIAVKRVSVFRDEETQAHLCQVNLDVAWEPRFKAFFLNLENAEVSAGGRTQKVGAESANAVSGASATDKIAITMTAPDRATAKIASLKGTIRAIGAPKMLEFAFARLKAGAAPSAVQDGVTVRLPSVQWEFVNKKPARVSVELEAEYPAGAIVELQSFEQPALLDNNRVWLTWTDPKTNKVHELEPSRQGAPRNAKTGFLFHFEQRGDTPVPSPNVEVTLRYRTPSRVVAITVPFAFQDLPLP